jgi:hypothetical protein
MSKYPSMSVCIATSTHSLQAENRALAEHISISTLGRDSFAQCGGSGSVGSVCFWASLDLDPDPLVRGMDPDPDSLYYQATIVRKP